MIKIQCRLTRHCLLLTCGLFLSAGCAEESSALSEVPRFEAPETFQADGFNWQREEGFSRSDTAVLSRFFQLQPGMQGSPAVAGVPVIYHGVQNRRRFYWIQGTADGPLWSCVEFSQGRYQFLEGTGNPYQSGSQ
ncbi:hypothetical protein [Gimesia sp.]|uniref:hypothetical protein n=1 Tax=Gimesia sp. TaxID=2024833 RepID=UPI000C675892|nr:hypothetical protein [Gimesia sp.]MAX37136.1 hypothetical protein [Gimesia sp.]HBL44640.1 hypothetical protein [Planctomycetaceae bacterium]|tara:strand:- start:605 stop:1009 length:405 start_codon:yes stop_codon:yes gene_type:complete